MDRRNASIATGSQIASTEVCERDVPEVPNVPSTTTTTTPPVALDVEPRGTSSPRISLPKGSPSHPNVTVTCRPRTWMQQITEGQINEPRREDASSSESNTSTIETLPEDIPDELGREWRVLHPFELSGVRFPMDSMPPNQRRVAENDALVELIQTTEYLDDVPTWGQRDYRLYPPQYGDPFYRGRGRGRGSCRGRQEWLQERQMYRPNGGFGRGFSQGNGIEVQQAPTDRSQPGRQEEEWSLPINVERRENEIERHETTHAPPPNVPPPMEDRLFTDWSSIDSPRERVPQCNLSARSVEPNNIQTVNQTEQPEMNPVRNEAVGNISNDVMTVPSTHQQLSQVDTRFIDRETNTSEVEVRSQRQETRTDILCSHSRDVQMPTSRSGISSHETDIIGGSPVRPRATDIIPQLDGPTSVCTKRRPEQEFI